MRLAAVLLLACVMEAQTPPVSPEVSEPPKTETKAPLVLRYEGKPMGIPFACTDDDMQWAGMSCSEEEPCPVYLELSGIDTVGNRLIVLGNIHTESTTLYALLLSSEDGGVTWQEPYERTRGAGLDHIQLLDFQNGWISGETIVPVARDPFFLITSDGGKSWRMRPVLAEGMGGAIRQFHFASAASGMMVIDRMQSSESSRYELYDTPNGGETWMIRRTSDQPITLPQAAADPESTGWRLRADARSKAFDIEKLLGEKWGAVASFLVQIGACKPAPRVMPTPPPEQEPETPAAPENPAQSDEASPEAMKSSAIELELFRNLAVSIAEEMGVVLRKTAYSANIKERRDYSCAVYDAAGETVAMGDHMPVHLGAMPLSVRHAIDALEIGPGDVAIVNDPFRGGTHLPDITAVSGVFLSGRRPDFYVANRAHHADVGGMSPGSMPLAREIFQEGIRIPPVLLVRKGVVDRGLMGVLLANVRTPEEREGDLLAQMMANRRGEERLGEIVKKYGMRTVRRNMAELQNYSERMTRAAIGRLRDGVYRFADYLDNDGIGTRPVKVQVAITIRGERADVDFTGSDAQVEGPVNANYAVALSATMYAFRCLVAEDVPYTAGLLRPIRVIAPERTVVNAGLPAAMAAGNVETSQRITDVVLGALAAAAPARIPAASSGTMNNLSLGGWDARRGRPFAYYETIAGGMGASAMGPGESAIHTHMTNSWNTPIEAFERQYPLRVRRYEVRGASGGEGKNRGGEGIAREIEFLTPCDVTILSDRRARGPYGLAGGGAGAPGRNTLLRGKARIKVGAKANFLVRAGDVLRIETPGGGGWGSIAKAKGKGQKAKGKSG